MGDEDLWDIAFRIASERLGRDATEEEVEEEMKRLETEAQAV